VVGNAAVGSRAEVEGLLLPDGSVLARTIVVQAAPTPTLTPEPSEARSEEPRLTPSLTAEQATGEAADMPDPPLELVPRAPQVPLPARPAMTGDAAQPSSGYARRDAPQKLVR